ncbi:FAD-binding oxidoreductase [Sandarakinorhabdus sp. DWP1-3-1]|uniref:FAD-binding oxidoreductase n=1 Tax=Sandarakinorhabdus sp. DWP1-3-1 TaxID=2804627 RepID=UPI003CF3F181
MLIERPVPVDAGAAIARLRDRFGDRVQTGAAIRDAHGRGEGLHDIMPPAAVVLAQSTAEVSAVVAICNDTRVPVIPFGVGSSLEGQIQALHGGISLDLSAMDRVLSTSAADLDCRVEAGVTREALNAHLKSEGLFFPLDPGANATLGGMAATRASGTNAVRYGTMREVTLGLTVVTPDGSIIRTGGRARKSSAGYDLTRLYVGSEGTLGVITELQLRLFGIPETIAAAVCQFDSLGGAIDAVVAILQLGIPLARIELLDALQMRACIGYSKLEGLAAVPTLFLEFHGAPAGVDEQVVQVGDVAATHGGGALRWARAQEERTALSTARHNAYWAARSLRPGCETFATDACVPISRLAECILETTAEAEALGLVAPVVGHVGDGNFHMLVLFDPADADERARAERLADGIARRSLAMGGTISGEHGVGLHKMGVMAAEHGDALAVMRSLKAALDPRGIMNPGKMLPG